MTYRQILLLSLPILSACGQEDAPIFELNSVAQKWQVTGKAWTEAELLTLYQGEKLYLVNCSACHGADGKGDNQMGAPALDRSPSAIGQKSELLLRILQGKEGSSMPAFARSLSDDEVAAIATFVRNAWQNRLGDAVSKEDVHSTR